MRNRILLASSFFLTVGIVTFAVQSQCTPRGLEALIAPFDKVNIYKVGTATILSGEVDTITDFNRLHAIPHIVNIVELSEAGRAAVVAQCEKEAGKSELKFRFVTNRLFIEGAAENDFEADRMVEIASAILQRHHMPRGTAGLEERSHRGFNIVEMLYVKAKPVQKAPLAPSF